MFPAISTRRIVTGIFLAFVIGAAGAADDAKLTGQDLYLKFCASCHGANARGDGPIAASLKKPPADLTLIASRYGQFPGKRIEEIVDGRVAVDAHGPSSMPVWGEVFTRAQSPTPQTEKESRDTIHKIVEYLRTQQRTN